jgi:hypothetical protein
MSDWKSLALAEIEMLPVGFRKKIPDITWTHPRI